MNKKTILHLLPIVIMLGLFSNCGTEQDQEALAANISAEEPSTENLVARGSYLISLMDCHACHTPKKMTAKGPVPDMDRMLMGYPANQPLPKIDPTEITPGKWILFTQELTAAVGPWGVSFAANLTPSETGLGNWTFEHFRKALKEGKHKGLDNSRPILPPMPWEQYRAVNEEDLRAMYEYLRTIPPIENVVPAPIPPSDI